jgi:hypothetical protein
VDAMYSTNLQKNEFAILINPIKIIIEATSAENS